MAWNEPGGNRKQQDPWGGNKQPPLDIKKLWQKLLTTIKQQPLLTPKHGKGPKQNDSLFSRYGHYIIPVILIGGWVIAGITVVDSGEQAVVLQFGKYAKTLGPGMHWVPAIIDDVRTVSQQQITSLNLSGTVRTSDNQILAITLNVQYHVGDPRLYLFTTADPAQMLEDAVSITVHQVLGSQTAEQLLTAQNQELNQALIQGLSQQLASLNAGLVITDITIQSLDVPAAVVDARTDALKAQQNSQLVIKQAQDNAAQTSAQAQAQAQQLLSEAQAYQQKVVLQAQGETARYLALLPEYEQNPQVTRQRLYVATMQHILSKTNKVFVDAAENSHVQVNFPVAMSQNANKVDATSTTTAQASNNKTASANTDNEDSSPITGYGADSY
jgi:membrane protease subunit HflK